MDKFTITGHELDFRAAVESIMDKFQMVTPRDLRACSGLIGAASDPLNPEHRNPILRVPGCDICHAKSEIYHEQQCKRGEPSRIIIETVNLDHV